MTIEQATELIRVLKAIELAIQFLVAIQLLRLVFK